MKRTVIGLAFAFSGVSLYIFTHMIAVNYMASIHSWDTSLGRYGQALVDTNSMIPFIVSILIATLGIGILLIELFKTNKN